MEIRTSAKSDAYSLRRAPCPDVPVPRWTYAWKLRTSEAIAGSAGTSNVCHDSPLFKVR